MLTAILRSLRTGVVTIRYPAERARVPERFRGAPEAVAGAPFDALPPAAICPPGAIAAGPSRHAVDLGRCVFCGRCAEGAGGAIALGREVELASRSRGSLVIEVERDGAGRAVPLAASPPAAA